jgi:hypothetical protein
LGKRRHRKGTPNINVLAVYVHAALKTALENIIICGHHGLPEDGLLLKQR